MTIDRDRARASASLLFLVALLLARALHQSDALEGLGPCVRLLWVARGTGSAVMRPPVAAATAGAFQFVGWICQLFAVWATMLAFHIHVPLVAAGLVLVLMNVATIFPLWPGNVGLVAGRDRAPARAATASPTRAASRSGSGCRRSRRRSGSASG